MATPPSPPPPPSRPGSSPNTPPSHPPMIPTFPAHPTVSLHQPTKKIKASGTSSKPKNLLRRFRSVLRTFPIITPMCKIPATIHDGHIHGGTQMTGTLFGHRKGRVNLAIQENPSSIPILLLELSIPTGKLLQDMGFGLVRIAMECEKTQRNKKTKVVDEPIWTMFCNGRKSGYAVKREATEEDLGVMQLLRVISMGAGVIPGTGGGPGNPDGEFTYMRAYFERVVGSRDSETYYMMNPDGNNGPELSIFFVRI